MTSESIMMNITLIGYFVKLRTLKVSFFKFCLGVQPSMTSQKKASRLSADLYKYIG